MYPRSLNSQHHVTTPLTNNAEYGLTLQALICNHYHLHIGQHASYQFKSNYNSIYADELSPLCSKIFDIVGSQPIKLLTYSQEYTDARQTTSPHNFLLQNGKTLSIRTLRSGDKIAPRTVGQAGFSIINNYFGEVFGGPITTQHEIRKLVYDHIHEILPVFIDHLFLSDYTVIINRKKLGDITIIKSEEVGDYSFSKEDLSFTRSLDNWRESITLKYHNVSIAEIQTHSNRTFKFRFIASAIPQWFKQIKETTETFGISAEAAICDYFELKKPASFATRVSAHLERALMPIIKQAFMTIPRAIEHTGSKTGARGGASKCSYDFQLAGDLTLSVKTNKGKKVCPPEVGQPGAETCLSYFSDFVPAGTTRMTNKIFKEMVFEHIEHLMPIYVKYLFDSDWLLWIYTEHDRFDYLAVPQDKIKNFVWEKELFTFTKKELTDWNESNTVKYNGASLGEFQVHNNRSCFKFRFNMPILISLLFDENTQ